MNAYRVYYFGCWGDTGHYWWRPDHLMPKGTEIDPVNAALGVKRVPDGTFPPSHIAEREGPARLVHVNGWTVLAFWDRSVDQRFGSNSAFAIEGTHDFPTAVHAAKLAFPTVWARFKFQVEPMGA